MKNDETIEKSQKIQSTKFGAGVNKPGRKKGGSNKNIKEIKDIVNLAFNEIGGFETFVQWAKENPRTFYVEMWFKTMPKEIRAEININKDVVELIHKGRDRNRLFNENFVKTIDEDEFNNEHITY